MSEKVFGSVTGSKGVPLSVLRHCGLPYGTGGSGSDHGPQSCWS